MARRFAFRLYVAGPSRRAEAAVSNLRFLCESRVPGCYEIEVVDALERPERAEDDRILATPTVLRLEPSPQLRMIGDLSDHGHAAAVLGLPERDEMPPGNRRHDR